MIENEEDLPNDIPALKSLVLDLSRRLQNAQHTIEAERKTTQIALHQAADYRLRLSETVQTFRLESSRLRNIEHKTTKQLEAQKFEENKAKGTKLYEKAKYAELDHQMTGLTKIVPLKLTRIRDQLKSFEDQQSNLKLLLQHYAEIDEMNDLFMNCIQHNQLDDCIQLLQQGVDVNYVDSAGYLAIHYACSQGYYDIVQLLLQNGSDHSAYLTGYAPIVLAAKQGYIHIIRLLLEFGADIEEKGRAGVPAVIAALGNHQLATVEFLITQGANIHTYDFQENNLLHTICTLTPRGNESLTVTGVGYVNPTVTAQQTATAMHTANTQLVHFFHYLLELGINVYCVNKQGHTPLQVALYGKNSLAITILTEWCREHPPLPTTTTGTLHMNEEEEGEGQQQQSQTQSQPLKSTATSSGTGSGSGSVTPSASHSIGGSSGNGNGNKSKVRAKVMVPSNLPQRTAIFTSRGGKILPARLPPNLAPTPTTTTGIPPAQQNTTATENTNNTNNTTNNTNNNNQQEQQQQLQQSQSAESGLRIPLPLPLPVPDTGVAAMVVAASEVMGPAGAFLEEDESIHAAPPVIITNHNTGTMTNKQHQSLPLLPLLAGHSVASSVTFD